MALRFSPQIITEGATISVAKTFAGKANMPPYVSEEAIKKSYLGTPVIDNIEFTGGVYTDLQGNEIEYPTLSLDTVLFDVSRSKRVIETQIQGRDNSIFEYIGNSNYEISATGVISNSDNIAPQDIARDLESIFNVPQQIAVVCSYLNEIFEIFNIVIKSHNITQVAGKRNELNFSFNASQDVSLEVNELE